MGQLASLLPERSQGSLPCNTEKIPREEAKAVTFRNGRELEEVEKKVNKGKGEATKSVENEVS